MKLYHYTTASVLVSILNSKEIWFTDFRFLNDAQEFYFAKEIVENTLKEFEFDKKVSDFGQTPELDDCHLSAFRALVDNFRKKLASTHFGRFQYDYMPYVFSLSEKKDSLSQWRAYGKGELCIEFDSDKLIGATSGKLHRVQHRKRCDTDIGLSVAIHKYLDYELEEFRRMHHFDIETVIDGSQNLGSFFRDQFNPIAIKHEGFEDEREWRLVREFSPSNGKRLETFIDGGRYPAPRAKVHLRTDAVDLSEIITGIVFGPGSDKDLAYSSVAALNSFIGAQYEAQFSDIPYRS